MPGASGSAATLAHICFWTARSADRISARGQRGCSRFLSPIACFEQRAGHQRLSDGASAQLLCKGLVPGSGLVWGLVVVAGEQGQCGSAGGKHGAPLGSTTEAKEWGYCGSCWRREWALEGLTRIV